MKIENLATRVASNPESLAEAIYDLLRDAHGWYHPEAEARAERLTDEALDGLLADVMEERR